MPYIKEDMTGGEIMDETVSLKAILTIAHFLVSIPIMIYCIFLIIDFVKERK